MDFYDIQVQKRTVKGKSAAKALKRNQLIPAVLYGPQSEPVILQVGQKDIELVFKKSSSAQVFVNLQIEGESSQKYTAMVKEVQKDPLTRQMNHVDFYQIDMNQKIATMVPVVVTGKSKGVEYGGMLQIIRRELEVFCLPSQVPDKIVIDITEMDMGESVHVDDIVLDEGVELLHDVNFTVVTCLAPKGASDASEEEEAEEEEELA